MPVFLDCETTGLDPARHQIWELALVEEDGTEHCWQLAANSAAADPNALEISRFWERRSARQTSGGVVARTVAAVTKGHGLVGAQVHFDVAFLTPLLVHHRERPAWNYRLIEVESLLAGALGRPQPWDLDEMAGRVGVLRVDADRHTALGDARWAREVYRAVMDLPGRPAGWVAPELAAMHEGPPSNAREGVEL